MKDVFKKLNVKADWWGLRFIEQNETSLTVRDEKLDGINSSVNVGVMAEVLVDGQFTYVSTTQLDLASVQEAFSMAVELAKNNKKWNLYNFSESQRPKAIGKYSSKLNKDFGRSSIYEVCDNLINATKFMTSTSDIQILSRLAHTIISKTNSLFLSSNGSDYEQSLTQCTLNLSMSATLDGDNQSRSNGGIVGQLGLELFNKDVLQQQSENISRDLDQILRAENCPDGKRDLIITPDQMYLQVHESIGHPLELDRILGDERNYAGWSFINKEDFGSLQYGSELLNVTFDPTISTELASYSFDDIGAKAEKKYLIKEGKLVAGIGSLESQKRLGVPGVSCARMESWNRPPIDRMANINVEVGSSSLDDMVSATENGILMEANKSWSIDDYRDKFQFGCEYGRLIEDGKLTKVVKNPNYRGQCNPFWNNLKMVGDESTMEVSGSFYCGKGEPNQVIRVGHAVPAALFSDVEVFGGGK